MRILLIRHAEPDYEKHTLTEKGFREANFLTERLAKEKNIAGIYVSPLNRAKETIQPTIDKLHLNYKICPWLHEFNEITFKKPFPDDREAIAWDTLPQDWAFNEEYYDKDKWYNTGFFKGTKIKEYYDNVVNSFDRVLKKHHYIRNKSIYKTDLSNDDTLIFVAHYGVNSVIISHLLNISPMILWHFTVQLPSTITSFNSEERRKGIVIFRMEEFGSEAHLYKNNEPASFKARFRSRYENNNERKDFED